MDALALLSYGMFFLTMALIFAIICLGLDMQWGRTGLFNVGVAGIVAVGAYTSALLTTPEAADRLGGAGLPIAVGWIAAAGAGGLVTLAIGAVTIRLRADYLAIATFGAAVAIQLALLNLQPLTGGPFGIGFIPRPFASLQARPFAFAAANLALVAGLVVVLVLALDRLLASPWGRVLRAIREDETAARALGKPVERMRLSAFALGGALMGLAGAVQAHFIGFIAPDNYQPTLTFQVWAMLIVGGAGNTRGAVLGAILVWALWAVAGSALVSLAPPGAQARAAALQIALVGIGLCAMLLWRPQGLLPERRTVSRHLSEDRPDD